MWRIRKLLPNLKGLLPEHLLNTSLDNALDGERGNDEAFKRKRLWNDVVSNSGNGE